MSAGPVSDRVYTSLRQRVLGRHYRPGARLDAAQLAAELVSSSTPVRDALHRLAGETLIEVRTGDGFYLPALDEPGLVDLYRWSGDLMMLATKTGAGRLVAPPQHRSDQSHAARTAQLFAAIAARSDNVEHGQAIERIGARLFAVRLVESEVHPDVEAELGWLADLQRIPDPRPLRKALLRYHARRVRDASAVVRRLYRSAGGRIE